MELKQRQPISRRTDRRSSLQSCCVVCKIFPPKNRNMKSYPNMTQVFGHDRHTWRTFKVSILNDRVSCQMQATALQGHSNLQPLLHLFGQDGSAGDGAATSRAHLLLPLFVAAAGHECAAWLGWLGYGAAAGRTHIILLTKSVVRSRSRNPHVRGQTTGASGGVPPRSVHCSSSPVRTPRQSECALHILISSSLRS